MSTRDDLAQLLAPQIPKGWRLIPYQDSVDVVDSPALMFKLSRIERLPQAPIGHYTTQFTLTLIDPATDPQKAEDSLDRNVEALLASLDEHQSLMWESAEKVAWGETNLAYDITLNVITKKGP